MLIIKNAPGMQACADKPFAVVIVRPGERYGRDFCLVNEKDAHGDGSTMVEFWDLDHKHGPVRPGSPVLGQFTGSRYYLSTLLEDGGRTGRGLNLDGGIPAWTVDGLAMDEVGNWLLGVQSRILREERAGIHA